MRDIVISAGGLAFLERIMRSCPPRDTNGGIPAKRKLHEISSTGKNISLDDFSKELGTVATGGVFKSIFECAKSERIDLIDERFIISFFGGKPHTDEISRKLEEGGVSLSAKEHPLYGEMILVSHTLLCLELAGNEKDGFWGIYKNGDISFRVRGLVSFREDLGNLQKGNMIWVHLSSIVSSQVDLELARLSFELQGINQDFWSACERIKLLGINNKALGYHSWAEKAYGLFCKS